MKTKKKIIELSEINSDKCYSRENVNWHVNYNAYIDGYEQCQKDMADKKYTEEDIKEAAYFFASYKIATSREVFDKDIYVYIESLNKQD